MAQIVPMLGAFGLWKLKTPWVTNNNLMYRCIALRRVEDLTKQGINIFKTYYEPMGLTQTEYTADLAVNVTFVSLLGTNGSKIYVPSTYVESIPDQTANVYDYTTVTVDLGPQPNSLDLSPLMDQLRSVSADFTGIDRENIMLSVGRAQSTTVLTQEQHVASEEARLLKVQNVKPSSIVIQELTDKNNAQELLIQQLSAQIHNLLLANDSTQINVVWRSGTTSNAPVVSAIKEDGTSVYAHVVVTSGRAGNLDVTHHYLSRVPSKMANPPFGTDVVIPTNDYSGSLIIGPFILPADTTTNIAPDDKIGFNLRNKTTGKQFGPFFLNIDDTSKNP